MRRSEKRQCVRRFWDKGFPKQHGTNIGSLSNRGCYDGGFSLRWSLRGNCPRSIRALNSPFSAPNSQMQAIIQPHNTGQILNIKSQSSFRKKLFF